MDLQLIRMGAIVLATGVAAWTDYKTGFIFDWITYPLMAAGVLFHGIEWATTGILDWNGIAVGAIAYALGFGLYYAGKIGGGDVKLFAGLALVLPFVQDRVFVVHVLLAASLLAVTVLGAYYALAYAKSKPRWSENKPGLPKALAVAVLLGAYLWAGHTYRILGDQTVALLIVPMIVSVAFLALETGIRKKFFLKTVKLEDLEEDEIIAREFCDEFAKKALEKTPLGVLTQGEINRLKTEGLTQVQVYRSLPPFGPFIFAGVLLTLYAPYVIHVFTTGS